MRTPHRVDTSTLGWVRNEIEQTLGQAREALGRYVEDADDDLTHLRLLATNVHQVAGTLQMVEVDGAAQLAQETEALASAAISGRTGEADRDAISELLQQGLARLSSYMDRLANGQPDRPVDNVDVINDLRRARGAEALDPFSFFNPDLEVYPSREQATEELGGEAYVERVRQSRRQYQQGLLKWLRNQGDEAAWQEMAEVVHDLYRISRFRVSMQIWWVARGYLEVLKDSELVRDDPRKHSLAQLDQLMRKLAEDSEAAIAREGSKKLVRYMLYQIGRSDVRTDSSRAVSRLFDLDTLLGNDAPGSALPDASVLTAIRERAHTSLESVRSALDRYSRSGEPDTAFEEADRELGEIADIAREEGVEELSDLSTGIRTVLFDNYPSTHSEEALLAAARALLFIEQTLEAPEDVTGEWRQEAAGIMDQLSRHAVSTDTADTGIETREIDAEALDTQELRRLVAAVAGQVEDSLKQAEQNLEQYAKDSGNQDSLSAVTDSLKQVHGAVRMLGQHRLCDLLELAIEQIEAVQAEETYPSDALIDALAVTIGTTDAYVKGVERDAPNIDTLLNRAMLELESAVSDDTRVEVDPAATLRNITESFDVWVHDNADYEAFRTLRQSMRDIGALAHQQGQTSLRSIAQEMTNLLDIVTDDPSFLSEEVEETLRRSLSTLSGLAESLDYEQEAAPPEDAVSEPEAPAPDDHEDDDEEDIIRETFAEEAQECLQAIETGREALNADHNDTEALTDVRRSFHTIKGSGRMAKARDIAELAWIVEDALNRCLEGSVPVSGPILEFVAEARRELDRLLGQGLDSSTELQAWRQRAAALQEGGGGSVENIAAGAGDSEEAARAPAPEDVGAGGSEPDAPGSEPVLQSLDDLGEQGHNLVAGVESDESASPYSDNEVIKIFTKEALSHISTIRSTIDACIRRGEAAISDELLRAVHTLQGNARSLHLVEMSEAYTALDNALHAKKARDAALRQSEMETLDALLVSTAKVLDHLNRDKRFPDVVRQQLAEIAGDIEETLNGPKPTTGAGSDRLGGLELVSDFVADSDGDATEPAHADPVAAPDAEADAPPGNVFDDLIEVDRAADAHEAPQPDSGPVDTPTRAASEETGSRDRDGSDADSGDLKDVFLEEATDILSRLQTVLQQAHGTGLDASSTNTLKRELHTLKGSARTAGVEMIGDLSHDAESMLESVRGAGNPPDDLLETLEEVHDTLANMVQGLDESRSVDPGPGLVQRLKGSPATAVGSTETDTSAPVSLIPEDGATTARDEPEAGRSGPVERPQPAASTVETPAVENPGAGETRAAAGRTTVRIHSNVLDKLVNYAGEVSISRAQMEEQLSGLKGNLNELRANVTRFSDQVRELDIQADTQIRSRVAKEHAVEPDHDFDPLEMDRYSRLQQLSRSLSESVDDLMTIQTGLNRFATQTEGVLSQQAMLNSELQDGLMSARMVPFNTLVPRLRHQARQTSRELGKEIDFTVTGGQVEVDRNILDQLNEALDHMIRNSLDHGIENAVDRRASGKPGRGSVRIDCQQEGNEVVLKFSDDGRGLDVDRIKARAIEAGLMTADSDLAGDEVIQLIVLSGFSTAHSVTQLSGRGVGLDVVNDAVRRLGGSLTLDNRPGEGVSFELRLPLSLSITQAMFVRCGGQRFAIPLGVIETVLKTETENLSEVSKDGDPLFRHDDRVYTLMDLTATLGLEPVAAESRIPILLVRMGARDVAARVDELIETDEIVVKQLGDHLGRMSGINGATITGDGSVVLILDVAELWLAQERLPAFAKPPEHAVDAQPRVMVVDDSLTVRKVTGRNLGRHGMEVTMARDGIDALDMMATARPDLMLVDIEMPRMDGYELTTRIREDVNYRDIPIIVITSRAGAKHRQKAMDLGANAYLTKPYQERELLDEVNALLNRAPQPDSH